MGKRKEPPAEAELREAVEAAVRGLRALSAADAEDAADASASALAASPEGPEALGRALLRAAEAEVRAAWERGWQPADAVRLARRDAAPAAARFVVDAVAAEARRYPAGAFGARWAGQLDALSATVWWGGDGAFLDGFARRERIGRFEAVAVALTALRLVAVLPRVEPVGPAPSRSGRPAVLPVSAPPKALGRIRALLAKAESTDFPEEAEAFSAKAQELMARHSIDAALLPDQDASADGPRACRLGVEGPYESAKALLLGAVAEANHCRAVWSAESAFSTVVGFDADLELVELMYTSLLVQADTAMRRAADAHHQGRRSRRTRDFRESFLIAYASRIGDRLSTTARDTTARQAPSEVLPVLAARELAVGETTERLFPAITSHRLRGRDAEGWARGREAADEARLR
ncbi:DUF2786 domain-containing protein [Streptomyces sp. AV19]|uniref:DUF2786 domain-containing protein n=1 Tax=Streptomyces sp. AV19 TaxID=2793068 RepID=UPI0018FE853A|nr:DUF2786 domain-containing protein [Streptomyces sp. AV19]MBH1935504.1 DUF2786 domain-containing protein [Streptomyces sp. AV19]MDG4534392.1 DUF2786 domain-containing protein [Streptomyces sp. AV19]